jgi:hypothetical protein
MKLAGTLKLYLQQTHVQPAQHALLEIIESVDAH